jgi:succinate dehydrogenase / fumarate reductase flavoprotein subunit
VKVIKCDVLIIGAGGAGLRAAIEARETSKRGKIVLVSKGTIGMSGVTAVACSDRMAFHATLPHTEPGGPVPWRYHAEDIYRIGGYVSDGPLAWILAKGAQEAFEYLDRLGVPFVRRPDGLPDQFITDGSDYARACYTGPRTAVHIEQALMKKISSMDITLIHHCMVVDLVTWRGRLIGALGMDEREGTLEERMKIFSAKTVILATGGAGEVFGVHVFPICMTGDGYAMAYRAGAELVNMEFIQIGPSSVKTKLNCSGSLMRAVPRVLNEKGEEFLHGYLPPTTSSSDICNLIFQKGASWPVSFEKPTHVIDVAMFKERIRGRRVFLDYSTNPRGFRFQDLASRWQERYEREVRTGSPHGKRDTSPLHRLAEINPDSIEWLREHGIDLDAGETIEVAPCVQHFQGGVKIGERGNTTLRGVYAAGECAGGQHGANRPGGNALLDGQVFGRITGREAALEAMAIDHIPEVSPQRIKTFLSQLKKMSREGRASEIRQEIHSITSQEAGVVRTEEGLKKGLKRLQDLRREAIGSDERGLVCALETRNLIDAAEMILRACLLRKESRGPHLFFKRFEDLNPLPPRDPEWRKYIVIRNVSGKMALKKRKPVGPRFSGSSRARCPSH